MVRLVFRPYTQIRRSICTSEPLRASTRVSSGFTLSRYSSPSFGSQQLCSTEAPEQFWHSAGLGVLSLSLRTGVLYPNTCIDVRLLGPCFKTGGLEGLCQHPVKRSSVARGYICKNYNTQALHVLPLFYPVQPMLTLLPSPSLPTISRTFSLSFQSAFHLSITVLVRYRSLANI